MAHTFDLATHWEADTNVMIVQGWYALPEGDGGSDQDYGVWNPGDPTAWNTSNPSAYPDHPYAIQDASVCNGGQRFIGSQLRPLAGLYSDTGRDAASLAHIDRMLQMVRRDGDPRGRIDAIACTLGHLAFTSYGGYAEGDSGYMRGLDNRYLHFAAMLARAEAASLTNCVAPNYEAYYVWQFLSGTYATTAARKNAVIYDMAVLATLANASSAGFKVDGRPVLFWYQGTLTETITNAEWNTVMESARVASGVDFFVIGRDADGSDLEWADGGYPWIREPAYQSADGDTVREKASNWVQDAMTALSFKIHSTVQVPGRIAMGNLSPGMWDWVLGWGQGNTTRYIPRGTETIAGQFDGYEVMDAAGKRPSGMCCVTWNGYPEGHCWEPTTDDNGEMLGALTEALATWEGDTPDPGETEALLEFWRSATDANACPIQYTQGGRQVRRARRALPQSGSPA